MGHTLESILPILAATAATIAFPANAVWAAPLAAGTTSGVENYSSNHNIGKALTNAGLSAGGSYIGAGIGNALGGSAGAIGNAGNIGQAVNSISGSGSIGNFIGNEFGTVAPELANVGVGSALGGVAGSQLATGLQGPSKSTDTSPWTPSQSAASSLPPSLSGISTLDPTQQASNLASQGTFGGGIGPEEQSYYRNLLNRQLVDQGGKVSDISTLSPVESTYNQQIGLGGYGNSTDLLKALSQWQQAA